jgi:choline dehydrogenase-like flavoprotein
VKLPGVGKNLQDHVSGVLEYSRKDSGTFQRNMRLDKLAYSLPMAHWFGQGFAADLPSGFMAFVKTRPELEIPDMQFLFRALPVHGRPYWPLVGGWEDGFGIRPAVLRPESRGSLKLASADPRAPIRIIQNFLEADNDMRTLRAGFKMLRDVAERSALKRIIDKELAPGPGVKSDAEIDAHLRKTSATVHHPLGTCKMGIDDLSVVDPELKVRGVERLRVVDASVMPDLVGGNINAPVIMIAEKGSDMIRGRKPLPAAAV